MPKTKPEVTILQDLNLEQKQAVMHEKGSLLIVAGAGTGKTMVITRRIAYLVYKGLAKPEEILALTFTDKAAAEMEERVDIILPYGMVDTEISTFHSFGDKVLNDNALDLGLSPGARVLSQPEQVIFFREHLFEFPLSYYRPIGNPTGYIQAILNLISRAKDEDVSYSEYLKYAKDLQKKAKTNKKDKVLKEESEKQFEIAKTYQKYQELLHKEGKIDFGDQIRLVLELFRKRPTVLNKYRKKYKYILVDEFQDTNHAQFEIVKLLSAKHKNITVSGDDDQSIYKFRGAALSNIMSFVDTYPDAKKVVLTKNYRSTQNILDSATRLVRCNNPDRLEIKEGIDKNLNAVSKQGKGVEHIHFDTLTDAADSLARLIKDKAGKGKYSYKDFAILVRANNQADFYLRSLNMLCIPWRFSGNQGLYSRNEIRLLMCFLKIISYLHDSVSLYHLSISEIYNLNVRDITLCMNYATRKNKTLYHALSYLDSIPELADEVSSESKDIIASMMEDIDKFMKMCKDHTTGEVLYKFITETGYLKRLMHEESVENEEKIQNIAKFFNIISSASSTLEHDRVLQFVDYLNMLIEAGDNPAVTEAELDVNAVNVLTVHKAKGLEFPVVVMVDLVRDRFPTRNRKDIIMLPDELLRQKEKWLPQGDPHIQEERRLFFVGMTRAKDELYLCSARDYGGKSLRKVSRFVQEALDVVKQDMSTSKASALEVIERSAPISASVESIYKQIPDSEVITISHLQIDDYDTCPLKYKYVHILRVPLLQHHSVIYGKCIHEAVQKYYRRKMNNESITVDDFISYFKKAWSSEGFLNREHEKQMLLEGRNVLKRFYKNAQKEKSLPSYIEEEFKFMLENNKVIGRWDRVDVDGDEVKIIDFKSSSVKKKEDADKKAKKSLQLGIYALAYKERFGKLPDYVQLYFLGSDVVGSCTIEEKRIEKVRQKIITSAEGIRKRDYQAKPNTFSCGFCAFQYICPYTLQKI